MCPSSPTRVVVVDPGSPDPRVIAEAARLLLDGGLVAFATETVYGLGAIATDAEAVGRIFVAKGRPAINPLIVHVADIDQARSCVTDWPADADRLSDEFWPGPLTMVLPRSAAIPDRVTAGMASVGVRCPAGRVARDLIAMCRRPLAAPSANRSNRLSPTRAEHVSADLDGRIDLILDSGPTGIGLESTVIDLTSDPPRLLRPGPISAADLRERLSGGVIVTADPGAAAERPTSPGQMAIHYAPHTPAFRVGRVEELSGWLHFDDIALLTFGTVRADLADSIPATVRLDSPERAARLLYQILHEFDAMRPRAIVVVLPPDQPEWLAIRDRLLRATRPLPELEGSGP